MREELHSSEIKAVSTMITQRKIRSMKENKVIITKIYTLEISVQYQPNLTNILQQHSNDRNKMFLPAQIRYNNIKGWNNAVLIQSRHNNHTKCISISNIFNNSENNPLQKIQEIKGIYSLSRKTDLGKDGY